MKSLSVPCATYSLITRRISPALPARAAGARQRLRRAGRQIRQRNRLPELFQCGEFDEARPDTVREQAALTPNAEVAIIPGAGHLTMIDAPEQANAVIRTFLVRVESEADVR